MLSAPEVGDGPAILQLQKWGDDPKFQLELSEFCEASISPTRELLLLLSHQYEAFLLPLSSGNRSSSLLMHADDSHRFNCEEKQEPSSLASCSLEQTTESGCAITSKHYPVISDVKSFTWGHWGDTYSHFKGSGFRELLIVSGDSDIIIHAFRYLDKDSCALESAPEDASTQGRWVEWGPTHSTLAKKQYLHGEFNDMATYGCSTTPQRWLQTFMTDVETIVSSGKCLTRFPVESSFPRSAEVVSFSIRDSTSTFLEFLSCTSHRSCAVDQSEETMPGPVDRTQISDLPHGIQSDDYCKVDRTSIRYKCSRVFSNSSDHLVGLVLTISKNELSKDNEDHLRVASNILVVVIELYKWGLKWVCSIDLYDDHTCLGQCQEWIDFQFLDKFLVCLSTSGLVCIWGAENGNLIARFDVLRSSGLDSKVNTDLNNKNSSANGVSAPNMSSFDWEADQESAFNISGTSSKGLVCGTIFRRLMIASHSWLLAVIDENGVIYVVSVEKYIYENQNLINKFMPPSELGMMTGWKVARNEIVGSSVFADLSGCHVLSAPDHTMGILADTDYIRNANFGRRKQSNMNTYSSGLTTGPQMKDLENSHSKYDIVSSLVRRVFLPSDRFNKEDCIHFSPFGITRLTKSSNLKEHKRYKIVHTSLYVAPSVLDDRDMDRCWLSKRCSTKESAFVGESIGCSFQGCLYVVSQDGLSLILPSVSVSPAVSPVESVRYWQPSSGSKCQIKNILEISVSKELLRPWQIEVLDRVLLYEGPEEAELICLKNGWDFTFSRVRRMQLALHYLKSDEIEKSLDMLVDVNLAEEGILKLLFTSVYQMSCGIGGENGVALASRLLALAACFATKMVRRYGLAEQKKDKFVSNVRKDLRVAYLHPFLPKSNLVETGNSKRLYEMAHFLEVIRNLQTRLATRNRRQGLGVLADDRDAAKMVDAKVSPDDFPLPIVTFDAVLPGVLDESEIQNNGELDITSLHLDIDSLALTPMESSVDVVNLNESFAHGAASGQKSKLFPLENTRDMFARWEIDKLDLKSVVSDALKSGRLPLAVLQLHLQRQRALISEKEYQDMFSEVRNIGRVIAYDLFLKGESGLAMATLQRLGEDIEIILRQLLFGTVRRSLRRQIVEEMRAYGWLRSHELEILQRITLIEMLYPSSSFWKTFLARKNNICEASSAISFSEEKHFQVIFHVCENLTIECGDIDGVVIGVWENVDNGSASLSSEDNVHTGYWACAAVWSDAWDQRSVDRIVLDQPFHMGVHVPWESQLEYRMSHNDLVEVRKLLDAIPTSSLLDGTLRINLNNSHSSANVGTDVKFPDYGMYICAAEELEPVCMDIPNVKIFRSSTLNTCSSWLKELVEQDLAKKCIFIKEYWDSTAEILPLLARTDVIFHTSKIKDKSAESYLDLGVVNMTEHSHMGTAKALHKLVIHHCIQYNLPNLLDLYLDHHNLLLKDDSLSSLLEAVGECHWAKWLFFSRIKGREYEASFSNARSNLSQQMIQGCNLGVPEADEIILTVDDMAEGGGEMAALATLMYCAVPMQKCLCSGSVNRHRSSSFQCTLENLRPGLQHFPTLWRTLVTASVGQDASGYSFSPSAVFGKSTLSDYVKWRYNIFSSSGGDTSLMKMLPYWFPKSIKRLVELFVQGAPGWHSPSVEGSVGESMLYKDDNYAFMTTGDDGTDAITSEATIQRSVEELYSSREENGFGVEHHLHRGRALAAFNHLLGVRAQKLKSMNARQVLAGQTNIQPDVQTILAPLTRNEGPLLTTIMALAIMHFEDSVLVASCVLLLELCGLSASMLRVDIAALLRISSYYNSIVPNAHFEDVSRKGSDFLAVPREGDLTISLARGLADDYIHSDHLNILEQKDVPGRTSACKLPSRALMTVLLHLEKASLPSMDVSKSCGSWISSGDGDGFEFRSQQKDESQNWSLVTVFCQIHHLPLSTKYLALLANGNDWVGFLTEAQIGGFPIHITIQVASQEFKDPRLKNHILTVLKSMQSARKKSASSSNTSSVGRSNEIASVIDSDSMVPMELFGILAECERQKNSGECLLIKAKHLRWSLLAMLASCFPDVAPLSCLTVWLEITAARETSSIKVNDISSKIASSVGAAVEATNNLTTGNRSPTFRYNRRNPKRRHIIDSSSGNSIVVSPTDVPNSLNPMVGPFAQEITSEEERKKVAIEHLKFSNDSDEGLASLSNMVAVLCEQHQFLPLLRAFEMFLPSCSLLPFIRSLQAFSQMRLSEASAHLASFSSRIREEPFLMQINIAKNGQVKTAWISSTAVKAADAMLLACPSAYEKRCLLQLLSAVDFGDGGSASTYFRRLYWKINLAEPSLRKDDVYLGNETLDDASLLAALLKSGHWEQARNWARQLESSGLSWKYAVHHVTETQAEAMVAEWKEFLWDIPEERAALWGHCQTLFSRYSFPALQAGSFFLRHAEAIEKDTSARELHEMLLLSLQWLSGTMTQSQAVYPLNLLREIETRVWLLAVESEAQFKVEGDYTLPNSTQFLSGGSSNSIIEQTASIVTKMDNHMHAMLMRAAEKNGTRENNLPHNRHLQGTDSNNQVTAASNTRAKRRTKNYMPLRRAFIDNVDINNDSDDYPNSPDNRISSDISKNLQLQEENLKIEASLSGWEERVRPAELERAVLSLLEFGQITAAKQLQHKLSPEHVPSELSIIDASIKLAVLSSSSISGEVSETMLDPEVLSIIQSLNIRSSNHMIDILQVLQSLVIKCGQGCGRGLCKRIIAVVKAAKILGLPFSEAFEKKPLELLQLLSLKAQDSLEEAKFLVQTHVMPSSSIAQILAESFLKGLLAAHRGGYMDSQKEEGPAPLLWRFSDFLKWAELCPSEPEVGHALMRLVMTGQDIPHACEVELLILSHHFYKSSACLDGVDVLVTLAANRVEWYVAEGDFPCLARLITGVGNFHALNFILNILIENGQLELLLHKYSTNEAATGTTAETVRGFRMAVVTSLKLFNPHDLDAFAMVYNHFDMKHEMASLLESRSMMCMQQWLSRRDKDWQNEDLLESMRHVIEVAEVFSTIDAGHKTHRACARASLLSLQIRIPDLSWLELSETNARRALVEQSRFQEALIVAEAYNLNQPTEWAPVLWNLMLKPDLIEQFVAEFVAVLPLQSSMLLELARYYRAEVAARGDQSHFSVWLSPGGLPAEWVKHLGRSFRCLLWRTRDLRVRVQLATIATGFLDVVDACAKVLDRVPDNAGPLILRRGHGGAYLPLM